MVRQERDLSGHLSGGLNAHSMAEAAHSAPTIITEQDHFQSLWANSKSWFTLATRSKEGSGERLLER